MPKDEIEPYWYDLGEDHPFVTDGDCPWFMLLFRLKDPVKRAEQMKRVNEWMYKWVFIDPEEEEDPADWWKEA